MQQLMTPDRRLVVGFTTEAGQFDMGKAQSLDQWMAGQRNVDLVAHRYGPSLLDILVNELGLVSINSEGLLQSRILVLPTASGVNEAVMKLLGKIAEAIIVRNCNADVSMNRQWARVARRGKNVVARPDNFRAVGTGLESTKRINRHKFNQGDPHRDVIWIDKNNLSTPLYEVGFGGVAGLQIKVSQSGMDYVYREAVATEKYEVPIVYFDLANDYFKVINAIYAEKPNIEIGSDIVCGREIDPSAHEEVLSHYPLVEGLVTGGVTPEKLMGSPLLLDAYVKQWHEDQLGSTIITI